MTDMKGPEVAKLETWLQGANADDLATVARTWKTAAASLNRAGLQLGTLTTKLDAMQGQGPRSASKAFSESAGRMNDRAGEINGGGEALISSATQITTAEQTRAAVTGPGFKDVPPPYSGADPNSTEAINYNKGRSQAQNDNAAMYADREAKAAAATKQLDANYTETVAAMKAIHKIPDPPPAAPGGGGPFVPTASAPPSSPQGNPQGSWPIRNPVIEEPPWIPPTTTQPPTTQPPIVHPPVVHPPVVHPPVDHPISHPPIDEPPPGRGPTPTTPTHPTYGTAQGPGPGVATPHPSYGGYAGGGTHGGGGSSSLGGALGAGAGLGGMLGSRGSMPGLSSSALSGSAAKIGSSSARAGGSVLGKSGAGSGAGGRAGAGAGSRTGAGAGRTGSGAGKAGSSGGRAGAGKAGAGGKTGAKGSGRGGAGGGAGGKNKRDKRQGSVWETTEDADQWLDDDGIAPEVLG